MKIYGYFRSAHIREITMFKKVSGVDSLFCDLLDEFGRGSSSAELINLLSEIIAGDTVVIESIDNAFNSIDELSLFLGTCIEKEVNIKSISGHDNGILQSKDSLEVINFLKGFIKSKDMSTEARKTGRKPICYPDNFLSIYNNFKANKINSREAAKQLGLSLGTFYSMVRIFES